MQNFLPVFSTSLPFAVVVVLALTAVAGFGVGMVRPRYLAYVYMAVFFFANSTSYGSLSIMASAGIYSRGSGLLSFRCCCGACWGPGPARESRPASAAIRPRRASCGPGSWPGRCCWAATWRPPCVPT